MQKIKPMARYTRRKSRLYNFIETTVLLIGVSSGWAYLVYYASGLPRPL